MKRTMAAKVLLAAGTASVALLATACEVEEGGTGDTDLEDPLLEEDGTGDTDLEDPLLEEDSDL